MFIKINGNNLYAWTILFRGTDIIFFFICVTERGPELDRAIRCEITRKNIFHY